LPKVCWPACHAVSACAQDSCNTVMLLGSWALKAFVTLLLEVQGLSLSQCGTSAYDGPPPVHGASFGQT
jgi:hypothetical protein